MVNKNLKYFSVIIPTHNRTEELKKCLRSLFEQSYPSELFEIIVVDDGSQENTESVVRQLGHENTSHSLVFLKQNHKGPAEARNLGIRKANGSILLFLGDDSFATQTLLEEHQRFHHEFQNENIAVLGLIDWFPTFRVTPLMAWLDRSGTVFDFYSFINCVNIDPRRYFYGSNISLKKKFLIKHKEFFCPDFQYPAFEDIELGYRLHQKGLKLKFNKDAISYHNHFISLNGFCRRMITIGKSSIVFAEKTGKEIFEDTLSCSEFLSRIRDFFIYQWRKWIGQNYLWRSAFIKRKTEKITASQMEKNVRLFLRGLQGHVLAIGYYFYIFVNQNRDIKNKYYEFLGHYCRNVGIKKSQKNGGSL